MAFFRDLLGCRREKITSFLSVGRLEASCLNLFGCRTQICKNHFPFVLPVSEILFGDLQLEILGSAFRYGSVEMEIGGKL